MSRKIGSFKDPKTGENHWFEPDTVRDYPLPKHRTNILGESGYKEVILELSSDEPRKVIGLSAGVDINNKRFSSSNKAEVDEMVFAEELFNAYVADDTFASREMVIDMQQAAVNSLRQELFKNGLISDGLKAQVYGEVLYGEDVVAVFDSVDISIGFGSDKSVTVDTDSVVSNITLNMEKEPSVAITAYGKTYKFKTDSLEQKSPGIVSSYQFNLSLESLIDCEDKEPLSPLTKDVTTDNPEYLSRLNILSSDELKEENIDDRFEDIFDF